MSYQQDPSDLDKLTQNSLFDYFIEKINLDYVTCQKVYNHLYDDLYNSEQELFGIYRNALVSKLADVPKLLSKIYLISFILNSEYFFRMIPDEPSAPTSQLFVNFTLKCHDNTQSIIQSLMNNEDMTARFIEFINNDINISSLLVTIHLDNLYNFPFDWGSRGQLIIPQNFVDIPTMDKFSQFVMHHLQMLTAPPVAAGTNYANSVYQQPQQQQQILYGYSGGKKNKSKRLRKKKHKSKNKKYKNKKSLKRKTNSVKKR